MSRRKQLRPQHIDIDDLNSGAAGWESPPADHQPAHVCSRCCAEFSVLSDLERHQRGCSPDPPVLIVNEDEDLPPSSPDGPAGEPSETVTDHEMEHINTSHESSCTGAELRDCFNSRSSHRSDEIPECIRGPKRQTDVFLCSSVFPQSSPQPGCSADQDRYSWMKRDVIIETLESVRVAVAHLSQVTQSDGDRSKSAVSFLLQQLLALQIQQIQQLQLIDQIRHQLLLFASHQAQKPETLVIHTGDPSSSESTNQLNALSSHLTEEPAAASETANRSSTQSANKSDIKDFTATDQLNQSRPRSTDVTSGLKSSQTFSEVMTTTFHEQVSKKQHKNCASSASQLHLSSQSKTSSLMFSKNRFFTETSANSNSSQPSSSFEHAASKTIPNISDVLEDLDALAALAQQRKHKNLKLSAPTFSPTEFLCKRTCGFCNKVLESNSASQVHLRSHAGERPYRCNICGSWFSTRGNLQVHFQRHQEKILHIQTNPRLVPVPRLCGVSSFPETAAAKWLERPLKTPAALQQSTLANLSSLIKKEDYLISTPTSHSQGDHYLTSAASLGSRSNPSKTFDSVETMQQRPKGFKSNFISKTMTTESEDSTDIVPNPLTSHKSTSFLSLKCWNSPKPQLPCVTADRRLPDPNECIICRRMLSCQRSLRMHLRTHAGERPHQCKLCCRAFTTEGNLKTHRAVHRAAAPLRVQHSCLVCQRKFMNAVVLQQHVHMHMEGHVAGAGLSDQKCTAGCNEIFQDKTKLCHSKNFSDDNNEGFLPNRLPRFKSLSITLSQSPSDENLTETNKKTSYCGAHGELQLEGMKTERPGGSNEESGQTNNQQAAEGRQHTSTFPPSDSSASERSLSSNSQTSTCFDATRLDEAFQTWHDSTALTPSASGRTPADLRSFGHTEDSPGFIHKLRETGFLKNTYCEICGKSFACQSALDIHYRSHTKERPFICTTCSRGFSTKGNLRQHMLTHQLRGFPPHLFEPSTPNQAPNCNGSMLYVGSEAVRTKMTAFLSSSLRNGSNLMSSVCSVASPRRNPKQHHCKTCGKSFSSSSALQIHERTHTGERPFACAVCGRAFTTKGNLKVHMGTHMWSSAPGRRSCRLSVGRSSVGFWAPVKLSELPHENPESVYSWNRSPAGVKVDDVIQSGDAHAGLRTVCLNELHHANRSDLAVVNRRTDS